MPARLLFLPLLAGYVLAMHATNTPAAHPLSLDDLFAMQRISDPQISPDGKPGGVRRQRGRQGKERLDQHDLDRRRPTAARPGN